MGLGVDFRLEARGVAADTREAPSASRVADGAFVEPTPDVAAGVVAAGVVAAGVVAAGAGPEAAGFAAAGVEAAGAVAPGEGTEAAATPAIDAIGEEDTAAAPPDDDPLPSISRRTPIAATKPTTMIAAMVRWTAAM